MGALKAHKTYHREPQVRKGGVIDGGVRSSVLGGKDDVISSLAEGRTETPQTRKMLAPTGPASGRIAVKKGHQERSKKPTRRTF